jgi:TetR/AcrR family transcriptional regulator
VKKPDPTLNERPDDSRARILDAALREFSAHGLAGARTEAIAAAAGVNKALLYYYFAGKEKLYLAAIEKASERVLEITQAVYETVGTPGERLLRMTLNHFDRILTQREFQSLLQQEMIRRHQARWGKEESSTEAIEFLSKRVFGPLTEHFRSLASQGIASGELIPTDWLQMVLAALGANVFYFLGAGMWREILDFQPFAPMVLEERRKVLLAYLSQAIFQDRAHGATLAAKVLADTPMPEIPPGLDQARAKVWGKS